MLPKRLQQMFYVVGVVATGLSHRSSSAMMRCCGTSQSRYLASVMCPVRHYVHKKSQPVRIANPCIDGVFQHSLSDSFVITGLLNAVLDLQGVDRVTHVIFLSRRLQSSDSLSEPRYSFTVDIRCRTQNGQHFLVEMQNDFRGDYYLKTLLEHSRMVGIFDSEENFRAQQDAQLTKRKKRPRKFWQDIKGFYSLVITNKVFEKARMKAGYNSELIVEPELVNVYELRHVKHLDRRYGNVPNQIVLLMLANLQKKPFNEFSEIEKWAYLFRDSGLNRGACKIEISKEIPNPDELAANNEEIKAFIARVNMQHLPASILEAALDRVNEPDKARFEGKGKVKKAKEIALKLLKLNVNIDIIIEATGLTREQIREFKLAYTQSLLITNPKCHIVD